jgi:serine/threonine protein kinase
MTSFRENSLEPGEVSFGRYQFGDTVGKGAFGKVYRALNVDTGDFCAIKQIEKGNISPQYLPGIMRECDLLKTLRHANVVTFVESQETENYLYYIMEYVEGGSLSKAVKKFGAFPEPLLARYIAQVLRGLQYLHSQGVIHRDIKGENILLTKQGIVKLVDFGSCTYQAMDKMLTVIGTPFWMAPEIIEMDGNARNTACDIWSLGCTIIELVTGNPPYWELGPMPAMFAMVNERHPPLPENISDELSDFLKCCFVREVVRRPTATMLLDHPWIVNNMKKPSELPAPVELKAPQEEIDKFAEYSSVDPEIIERLRLLEKENESLNATVRSLKMHLLKMMKEKKQLKDQVEKYEAEVASLKSGQSSPPQRYNNSVRRNDVPSSNGSVNSKTINSHNEKQGQKNFNDNDKNSAFTKSPSAPQIPSPPSSSRKLHVGPAFQVYRIQAAINSANMHNGDNNNNDNKQDGTQTKTKNRASSVLGSLTAINNMNNTLLNDEKAADDGSSGSSRESSPTTRKPSFSDIPLKPGDKCQARRNTGDSWHRAIVEEVTHKGTVIVTYLSSGKRDEVAFQSVREYSRDSRKRTEKDKGKTGSTGEVKTSQRKHVAAIFNLKH